MQYLWSPKKIYQQDPRRIGLAQLALPILLESILRSTVNLADVAFLSRVSDSVVSAVSVSSQYIMLCQIIASAVATGSIVCINQAIGMKNMDKVNKLYSIAVVANVLLGLIFGGLFLFFSDTFLKIMSLEEASIASAARYMRICGGMMVFRCIETVLSSICRSMGHTKAPLMINVVTNIINLIGNYLVVFHPELLGNIDPVAGVALASVSSWVGGMILGMIVVGRTKLKFSLRAFRPFPREDIGLVLSVGIPGGLNNLAYSLSQLVTTSIISLTGDTMVASKVYVSNLVHYIALIGMAFSSASTIMVGYRVGEGKYDEADTIRKLVTRIALCSNIVFSLLLICVRQPLMGIFTKDPVILEIACNIIMIDLVVEIGRALNNSLAGALQAAGDVKYQLVVNQGSGWLVSVLGSYILAIVCGLGLYGVWIAFALDEMTRGLILVKRWNSNKWIEIADKNRKTLSKTTA